MTPKKPRPIGRLSQLSKRNRLVRRALGQWVATDQQTRNSPLTRFQIADADWRGE
jgi:hypothetical protein